MEDDRGEAEPIQILFVVKDMNDCMEVLMRIRKCHLRSEYDNLIRQGRYHLINIIEKLKIADPLATQACKEDMERDIFKAEYETEMEQTRIIHLRKEWNQQQRSMARLQDALVKKRRMLLLHSNYCSAQGGSLCSILAALMDNKKLVEWYLSEPEKYLLRFIKIAEGCLSSFIKSYNLNLPLDDTSDFRYVLALYTCVRHLSNSQNGIRFLVQDHDCRTMISEIIKTLPSLRDSSIDSLTLTLLKVIHNLAQEDIGVTFLKRCPNLLKCLNVCLHKPYHPRMHRYVLEIVEALTKRINDIYYLEKITSTIGLDRLKELSGSIYMEVNQTIRNIFQNVEEAVQNLLEHGMQGDTQRHHPVGMRSHFPLDNESRRKLTRQQSIDSELTVTWTPSTASDTSPSSRSSPTAPRSYHDLSSSTPTHSLCNISLYKKILKNSKKREAYSHPSITKRLCPVPSRVDTSISGSLSRISNVTKLEEPFINVIPMSERPIYKNPVVSTSCLSSNINFFTEIINWATRRNDMQDKMPRTSLHNLDLNIPSRDDDIFMTKSNDTEADIYSSSTNIKITEEAQAGDPPQFQTQLFSSNYDSLNHESSERLGEKFLKSKQQIGQESKNVITIAKRTSDLEDANVYKTCTIQGVSAPRRNTTSINPFATNVVTVAKRLSNPDDMNLYKNCTIQGLSVPRLNTSSIHPYNSAASSSSTSNASTLIPSATRAGHQLKPKLSKPKSASSVSEIEKELRTHEFDNEKSLIPWNPENRMVVNLTDVNKVTRHYAQNRIRITSRVDSSDANRNKHHRVITRIKIPGLPFQRWLDSTDGKEDEIV